MRFFSGRYHVYFNIFVSETDICMWWLFCVEEGVVHSVGVETIDVIELLDERVCRFG